MYQPENNCVAPFDWTNSRHAYAFLVITFILAYCFSDFFSAFMHDLLTTLVAGYLADRLKKTKLI